MSCNRVSDSVNRVSSVHDDWVSTFGDRVSVPVDRIGSVGKYLLLTKSTRPVTVVERVNVRYKRVC